MEATSEDEGALSWELFHVDGRVLLSGRKMVKLRYGESIKQKTISLAKLLERHGRDRTVLRFALEIDGTRVSEDSVFLAPPRFVELPRARTRAVVKMLTPRRAALTFTSSAFQHRFAFDLPEVEHRGSDNYFELFPRESKTIEVELTRPQTLARLQRVLAYRSLVDTY